jgi:hypothetical protein
MNIPDRLNAEERPKALAEWRDTLDRLVAEVGAWAERRGWRVSRSTRELNEELLGSYSAPVLEIELPSGQVVLEPIARVVMGATGRVDLYAWPTLYRVMLLHRADGNWIVRTDSGLKWPHPWNEETFVELAAGLSGAS